MIKGDVVLIRFPFTDLSGSKLRPAVVLIATPQDTTVCFITSQLHQQAPTDIRLLPDAATGIKKPSLIRISKLATLDRRLAAGLLGRLPAATLAALNTQLMKLLQLP